MLIRTLALMSFVCATYVFGEYRKIDTSRLHESKKKTDRNRCQAEERHKEVFSLLTKQLNACVETQGKEDCSACEQAKEEMRKLPQYEEYYLPVARELAHYTWKLQCLDVIINAAENNEDTQSDIVKMTIALNEMLENIKEDLADEYRLVAHNVERLINKAIKLEDRLLGVEEAQNSIPEYE
jgi:hypothetical protein